MAGTFVAIRDVKGMNTLSNIDKRLNNTFKFTITKNNRLKKCLFMERLGKYEVLEETNLIKF